MQDNRCWNFLLLVGEAEIGTKMQTTEDIEMLGLDEHNDMDRETWK